MPIPEVKFYIDYKSPYAYLAIADAYQLEMATGVELNWLPLTLDIPSYLGDAKVDAQGNVIEQSRNAHQWRRVKYSYMDCRREANRRGLTIRGPKKIFDSSLANIGLLFAREHDVRRSYNDKVFERFWKRELDIEDASVIASVLAECGAPAEQFVDFVEHQGRRQLGEIQDEAEAAGVFGVPSLLIDGVDLYWGREHFAHVRQAIDALKAGS